MNTWLSNLAATFNIVRYDFDSTVGTKLGDFVLDVAGGSNNIMWNTQVLDNLEGIICLKCETFPGSSEPNAEFRVSRALQCDTEFS